MPHSCVLITIAMQLTCVVDKEIICTDNESLAQLLSVRSCESAVSRQDPRLSHSSNNAELDTGPTAGGVVELASQGPLLTQSGHRSNSGLLAVKAPRYDIKVL